MRGRAPSDFGSSSRHGLFLALILAMLVASGCREITEPPLQETEPAPALLVLTTAGQPASMAWVRLSDEGYTTAEPTVWSGSTTEEGLLLPELPPGTYTVGVNPIEAEQPTWVDPRLELRDGLFVLDPRPRVATGFLHAPEEYRITRFRVDARTILDLDTRPVNFTTSTLVRSDGSFEFVPIEGAPALITLTGNDVEVLMREELSAGPGDSLDLTWEPVRFEVRLTLAGEPLPGGRLAIRAKAPGSSVRVSRIVEGPVVDFLGAEGPGTLEVQPERGMPFLPLVVPVEFVAGSVPVVEVGTHRLDVEVFTSGGLPVYGADLRVIEAEDGQRQYFDDSSPSTTVYVRPGSHLVEARLTGFDTGYAALDVRSDSTARIELTPSID